MNTEQAEKLLAVASSLGLLIELKSNWLKTKIFKNF